MAEPQVLSPLDAAFLYLEGPTQPLHVGCVLTLDGPLEFPAFGATMAERLGAIPRYRQRPVRPALDWHAPTWEPAPRFDARRHLRHVAVPGDGGTSALQELVEALFASALDHELPLWEVYLIDGLADGTSAILCKMHHCMIDGVSGAQVLQYMTDGAPEPTPAAAPQPPASPSALRRLREGIGTWLDPAQGRAVLEAAGTMAGMLRDPATILPFNGPLSGARRVVWSAFPLERFLAIRGALGCKLNDVVLAVISGALRRYLADRKGVQLERVRLRTLVPVNLRTDAQYMTLGNLVSGMFPSLPVHLADPIERLRHVSGEMQALKRRGQAQAANLLMRLSGVLPSPLGALLGRAIPERPLFNTVCTNVPGPRDTRRILGRAIVDVHPLVPLFQGMGLEFAIFSYAGRLSITATADPALVPDAERVATALHESAAELFEAALGAPEAPRPRPAPPAGPTVADLMTRQVMTIAPEDTLAVAWRVMGEARIRHLPVVDTQQRLLGLVTHRDLLSASASDVEVPDPALRVRQLATLAAADVMETHLAVSAPNEPAAMAGTRMVGGKIGCLPVIDATSRLVGIVTEEDFMRWATAHMEGGPPEAEARSA